MKTCFGCLSLSAGCKLIVVLNLVTILYQIEVSRGHGHTFGSKRITIFVYSSVYCIVLLFGTFIEDRCLLNLWMTLHVAINMLFIPVIFTIKWFRENEKRPDTSLLLQRIALISMTIVMNSFFGLVVFSFARELERKEELKQQECLNQIE